MGPARRAHGAPFLPQALPIVPCAAPGAIVLDLACGSASHVTTRLPHRAQGQWFEVRRIRAAKHESSEHTHTPNKQKRKLEYRRTNVHYLGPSSGATQIKI